MTRIALWFILLYQRTISPDHSALGKLRHPNGYCRFYPSCSEYGRLAIEKRGIFFGSWKAFWRVLRCNPWSRGGADAP